MIQQEPTDGQVDQGLRLLQGGMPPARAAGLGIHAADLEELLEAADAVRDLPRPVPRPEVKARVREILVEHAERRRVAWVHSHALPHRQHPSRPRFGLGRLLLIGVGGLLGAFTGGVIIPAALGLATKSAIGFSLITGAVVGVVAGRFLLLSAFGGATPDKVVFRHARNLMALMILTVFGAALLAAVVNTSEPSSAFYPIKRAEEAGLLGLTSLKRDPVATADLYVKLADFRLREAEAMVPNGRVDGRPNGNPDLTLAAVRDHYQDLRWAAVALVKAPSHGHNWLQARDRFVAQESQAVDAITDHLVQFGFPSQASLVKAEAARFADDRKALDEKLSVPGQAPNPTPSPAAAT